jgi:hypothetical protein
VRLLALAGLAVVLSACGSSAGDPKDVAVQSINRIVHNDYAKAWEELYSKDRAVATRDEYVGCESRSPVQEAPRKMRALSVGTESVGIGDGTFVDSQAVKVQLDFRGGRLVHTVHLVKDGGKWRWILPAYRYRDYKDDVCPTDAGSSNPTTS